MAEKQRNIEQTIETLLTSVQSLQLATINKQGAPENSYTPYLYQDGHVYVFISELAAHTQNLSTKPCASLLFIEDEASCQNIFARKRLILDANASFVERTDEKWRPILDLFEQARGKTVSLLRTLPDFWLVEFTINHGSFVQGFGQAFQFSGTDFGSSTQVTGK